MAETVTTHRTTTTKLGANAPRTEVMCRVTVRGMEQAAINALGLMDFSDALVAADAPGNAQVQVVERGTLSRLESTWEYEIDQAERAS